MRSCKAMLIKYLNLAQETLYRKECCFDFKNSNSWQWPSHGRSALRLYCDGYGRQYEMRRGIFKSVFSLIKVIDEYIENHNLRPKAFEGQL